MIKIYKVAVLLLTLFILGNTTRSQHLVENFENGNLTGWAVKNNTEPKVDVNRIWYVPASPGEGVGEAFNGTPLSYRAMGLGPYDADNSTLSQWLITPPIAARNGDEMSFYTKSLLLNPIYERADRLIVKMAVYENKSDVPDVGNTATSVGDFTRTLIDINPTYYFNGYPNTWTKYSATVDSLPDNKTYYIRFAFWYYIENAGCNNQCPDPPSTLDDIANGISAASDLGALKVLGDAAAPIDIALAAKGIYDQIYTWANEDDEGYNGLMIGIDNFVYKSYGVAFEELSKSNIFTDEENVNDTGAVFLKDMCKDLTIYGYDSLNFYLYNYGSGFNISDLNISGPDADQFEVMVTRVRPAPNALIEFNINFKPTSSGIKSAVLNVVTDDATKPIKSFKIRGKATGGDPPGVSCPSNIYSSVGADGTTTLNPLVVGVLSNITQSCGSAPDLQFSFAQSYTFDCSNIGMANPVVLNVTDHLGQTVACTTNAVIRDGYNPEMTGTSDTTYYLSPGYGFYPKSWLVAPNATDNCSIVSIINDAPDSIPAALYQYIRWKATDVGGHHAYFSQTIHVLDTVSPTAICKDISVGFQGQYATVQASALNNGSYDNRKANLTFKINDGGSYVDSKQFTCAHGGTTQQLQLVVIDPSGNESTCTANVTIKDPNNGTCRNYTLFTSLDTTVTLQPYHVFDGGTGSCGLQSISLSKDTYTCDDVNGVYDIEVSYVTQSGIQKTCSSQVTFLDRMETRWNYDTVLVYTEYHNQDAVYPYFYRPDEYACQNIPWNITKSGATSGSELNISERYTQTICNVGKTIVNGYTTNPYTGQYTGWKATVIVKDTFPPYISSYSYDAVNDKMLDWNPLAEVDQCYAIVGINNPFYSNVNGTSGEWGYEITGATISRNVNLPIADGYFIMDTLNIGVNTITYTATDPSGNSRTVSGQIIVSESTQNPTKVCPTYTTIVNPPLNNTITIKDPIGAECVPDLFKWNYQIKDLSGSYTWSSQYDIPDNTTINVNLQADNQGPDGIYRLYTYPTRNGTPYGVCVTDIYLLDRTAPEVKCQRDATVSISEGSCDYDLKIFDPIVGSYGHDTWWYKVTGATTYNSGIIGNGSDHAVALNTGENIITIWAKDAVNNQSSCSYKVTVVDDTPPMAVAPSNETIAKGGSCTVDVGTCATVNGFQSAFATNRIQFFNTNSNGSLSKYAPDSLRINDGNNASKAPGISYIRIPIACSGTLSFDWLYNPNSQNGLADQLAVYKLNLGNYKLLTNFDTTVAASTRQSSNFSITVEEGDILSLGLISNNNGTSGSYLTIRNFSAPGLTTTISQPVVTDTCDYTITSDIRKSYPAGEHTITYKVTDRFGNSNVMTQQITVTDNNTPNLVCKNDTVYLDASGNATLTPEEVLTSCASFTTTLSQETFTCADTAAPVSVIVTTTNSLSVQSTCTTNVTVLDTIKPDMLYNNITFTVNPSGETPLPYSAISGMFRDNCGIDTVICSVDTFYCEDVGLQHVVFTATDISGNERSIFGSINITMNGFSTFPIVNDQTVCEGESAEFYVPVDNFASYKWQKEIENPDWENVGSSVGVSGGESALAIQDSLIYVAMSEGGSLVVKKFSNGSWTQVGSAITSSSVDLIRLVLHPIAGHNNLPYVAFRDLSNFNRLNLYWFNGTSWISSTNKPDVSISHLDIGFGEFGITESFPHIFYTDQNNSNKGSVKVFNYQADQWVNIESDFTPSIQHARIRFNKAPVSTGNVASVCYTNTGSPSYINIHNANAIVKYIGGQNAIANPYTFNFDVQYDGNVPYVIYKPVNTTNIKVIRYINNKWEAVGNLLSPCSASSFQIQINNGTPYITYTCGGQTRVLKLIDNVWVQLGSAFTGTWDYLPNRLLFMGEVPHILTRGDSDPNVYLKKLVEWEDIPGATNDSLLIDSTYLSLDGIHYRCVYNTGCTDGVTNFGRLKVNQIPEITSIAGDTLFEVAPGSVTLNATSDIGNITWYNAASGGTELYEGSNYSFNASSTNYYYASASTQYCTSEIDSARAYILYDSSYVVSRGDTICPKEFADIKLHNFQTGYKYRVYRKDMQGNDSLTSTHSTYYEEGNTKTLWSTSFQYPITETDTFTITVEPDKFDAPKLLSGDDYVDFGMPNHNFNKEISIQAWIYSKSDWSPFPWMTYTALGTNGDTSAVWVWDNGVFNVNYGGNTFRSLNFPTLPRNEWVHVSTVADSVGLYIYYNDSLVASLADPTDSLINNVDTAYLIMGRDGRYPINYHWTNSNLYFDDLKIWNVARSGSDIANDMNSCFDGTEPGLLQYTNFDQYLQDSTIISGKGNHGKMVKFGWQTYPIDAFFDHGVKTCMQEFNELPLDTVIITVNNLPTIKANVWEDACLGDSVLIIMESTDSTADITWYSDQTSTEALAFGDSIYFYGDTIGDVWLYAEASGSCGRKYAGVSFYPSPEITATATDTVCPGWQLNDLDLYDDPGMATLDWDYNYLEWYVSDTGSTEIDEYKELYENDTIWAEAISYYDCGVSKRVPAHVYVRPAPELQILNDTICAGDSALLIVLDEGLWRSEKDVPGSYMFTGDTFYTPPLNADTSYWVYAITSHCFYSDSAFEIKAVIADTVKTYENVSICYGESYSIGGSTYNSAGTYTDYFTTGGGCDSAVITRLMVLEEITKNQEVDICSGGSYTINGNTYTSAGTYLDTLTANNGCDSIITTVINIQSSLSVSQNIEICDGESVTVGTSTYTETGNYYDTLTANGGCDSIVNTFLLVYDVQEITKNVTICSGSSYTVGNNTYTTAGTYKDTLTSLQGCDSIVTTRLIINQEIRQTIIASICSGTSYTLGGATFDSTGTYVNTFTAAAGCDSIVTLDLTVRVPLTGTETISACGSYTWNGVTYTSSTNTPTDTLTNASGCDSIVTLNLTILNATTGTETVSACGSYTWNGVTYTASNNTATDTLTNAAGCDSIVTLDLTINNVVSGTHTVSACESYVWNGVTYTVSNNTDTDTLTSAAGCDSIVNLDLTILNATTGTETVSACGSYTWNGVTYTASNNTATDTLTNAAGCDSIVTLDLTILNITTGTETVSACGSYTWNGVTYTASNNTATDTLTNAAGCDSIVTLDLTINNVVSGTHTVSACESYIWNGVTYTASNNTDTDTLTSAAGCDSIVTLDLTILNATTGTETVSVCGSYTWNGVTYTASNSTATDTLTNAAGCDSIVTLDLTILNITTGTETVSACGSYTWNGVTYTASNNTATDTLTNAAGCDSIVTLNLTILNATTGTETVSACGSYTWNGVTYTASNNTATDTLTNAAGCDSIVTLDLTIYKPSALFTQSVDTTAGFALTIVNKSQGKDMTYLWKFGDGDSATGVAPYHIYPDTGLYNLCLEVTDANNCTDNFCDTIYLLDNVTGKSSNPSINIVDSTRNVLISVEPVAIDEHLYFNVYPNPNTGLFTVETDRSGLLTVSNAVGALIYSATIAEGRHKMNLTTQPPGIYFIVLRNKHSSSMFRIVIEQ